MSRTARYLAGAAALALAAGLVVVGVTVGWMAAAVLLGILLGFAAAGKLLSALHPFWQFVGVLLGSWLLFEFGIAYVPPLLGVSSAPVPDSVVVQYVLTVAVALLLYVSADAERWSRFREPVRRTLTDEDRKGVRRALFVAVPLLVGWFTYQSVKPSYGAPAELRSVHPAPPARIDFRGETMRLTGLANPLRERGDLAAAVERGAALYVENCVPCHGDRLDGEGHMAHAFSPVPADFTSGGTLPQLQESYVFWRIAKGGPGLPREGTPWNSAMPAWEHVLTAEEIWSVILFLYEQTGATPRTWEEEEAGGEGGH